MNHDPLTRGVVLAVEDEPDILEVIEHNLRKEGYRVLTAEDGESALRILRQKRPDLLLLDIMIPRLDGIEICRRIRADPSTRAIPVIMVTAKGEESDVVLGLGVGADDYVVKPFSPRELLARVRAALRRGPLGEGHEPRDRVVRGRLSIDAARHEARIDETLLVLTATEFRLLHWLASHPGRVFTREQILNRIIAQEATVLERNVDVHIRAVRRKLGPCRDMLETIRGVGYRFRDAD